MKTLPLAFVAVILLGACQSPNSTPPDVSAPTAIETPAAAADTTDPFAVPKGYVFNYDSSRLGEFIYSWYLLAHSFEYQAFQQELIQFPLTCTVQDSLQREESLTFPTLDSLMQWRKAHRQFFNLGNVDPRRVLYEGYPLNTFDSKPFDHFDSIPETDNLVVTYIGAFAKTDYYFQKKSKHWLLVKSAHKLYAQKELDALSISPFENFLLRFTSDLPFRLQHTRFPLKYTVSRAGSPETVTYRSQKDEEEHFKHLNEIMRPNMAIYPNINKKRPDSKDMYLTVRNEGGGCGWQHFQKTKQGWMLMAALNCSN